MIAWAQSYIFRNAVEDGRMMGRSTNDIGSIGWY